MYCLIFFLNTFTEGAIFLDWGREFQSFGAEQVKNRQIALFLIVPLAVDLRERVWVCDVGFRKFEIYSCARLFNALYVRIALL